MQTRTLNSFYFTVPIKQFAHVGWPPDVLAISIVGPRYRTLPNCRIRPVSLATLPFLCLQKLPWLEDVVSFEWILLFKFKDSPPRAFQYYPRVDQACRSSRARAVICRPRICGKIHIHVATTRRHILPPLSIRHFGRCNRVSHFSVYI